MPPGTLVYTGHREESPAKVISLAYTDTDFKETQGYLANFVMGGRGVLWTDVCGLTDAKLIEKIGTDHHIHPLALEDVLDTQQRSKLEEFDNGLFFIVHHLKVDCTALEIHSEQIALFAGKNFLVSFQEDPDDTLAPVRKRCEDGVGRLRKKGSDYLAYALLDLVVDSYYSVLDELETQALEVETSLHSNGALQTTKARMFALKRVFNEFRHRILPLREAVTRLYRTESDLVEDSTRLYLRDLVDHVRKY
ncbi:MAG: hypothetical protein IPH31_00290 [Lewinellaceae bacterium]|nr:hypothetical protein [Lewinellaceae bacterium]